MVTPLPKPVYFSQPLPEGSTTIAPNGAGLAPAPLNITEIDEPTESAAPSAAEELGEMFAAVARDAVSRAVADSVSDLQAKIDVFKTESMSFVNRLDTISKEREKLSLLREEVANSERQNAIDSAVISERSAALKIAESQQRIPLRHILAGSLLTASAVWLYTIFDPEPYRIAAAGICSLVTLGPIIALYWRKG